MATPEIISLLVAVVGLVGLLVRKSKCFVRHVGYDTDWGVGFTEYGIVPEKSPHVRNR